MRFLHVIRTIKGARGLMPHSCMWWRMVVVTTVTLGSLCLTTRTEAQSMSLPLSFLDTTAGTTNPRFKNLPSAEGLVTGKFAFPWCFLDSTEAPSGSPANAGPPLRVLFLGNSLTFYNEMPRMFSALTAAGTHRRVVVGMASLPGVPLSLLWTQTDAATVVSAFPWDIVVVQLQPQSIEDADGLSHYARAVQSVAAARHAQLVGWGQFGAPQDPAVFQAQLNAIVAGAAHGAGATLAPIAAAWVAMRHADSIAWRGLFYNLDKPKSNTHPSQTGSYLMALMFYQAITGKSPVGLPATAGTAALSADQAALLQRVAASVKHQQVPTLPIPTTSDSTHAPGDTSPSTTSGTRYVAPMYGALDSLLRADATSSAGHHHPLLVWVSAVWCVPCHALERAMRVPVLQKVFQETDLLKLDFDVWGPQFAEVGFPTKLSLPTLLCLNSLGQSIGEPWINKQEVPESAAGQNTEVQDHQFAEAIAPSLSAFVKQCRKAEVL